MTTRSEIAFWFDQGVKEKKTHLLVVCDTFDHEDYPVFAESDDDAINKYAEYNGKNMQRVMEVYDLKLSRTIQMGEFRAFHLPKP